MKPKGLRKIFNGNVFFVCICLLVTGVFPLKLEACKDPINWTPKNIEQTIGLGDSGNLSITLKSNVRMNNVDLWVIPKLKPFVRVSPSHFNVLKANTTYNVTVSFDIPNGTPTGIYAGTIHLKQGSKTYPQTLKVALSIVDAAATIGPTGGVVEVTDPSSPIYGASIIIPEAALSGNVTISIQPVSEIQIPPLPEGANFLGGLDLKPDGLAFSGVVKISMPIALNYLEGTPIPIISYDYSEQEYYFVTAGNVIVPGNLIQAELNHFSSYIATTNFVCKCSAASVDLQLPLTDAYWRIHSYETHVPTYGYRYAADFWYTQSQKPDIFGLNAEGGRGKTIRAAHDGRVYLYAYDITNLGGNGPSIQVIYDPRTGNISIPTVPETSFKFMDKNSKLRIIDLELLIQGNGGITTNYTHLQILRDFVVPFPDKIKTAIKTFYNSSTVPPPPQTYVIDTGINVVAGQQVGFVSNYGATKSGPHLHFMAYLHQAQLREGFGVNSPGVPCRLDNEDFGGGATVQGDFILDKDRRRPKYFDDNNPGVGQQYEYSAMPRNHFKSEEQVMVNEDDVQIRSTPGGTEIPNPTTPLKLKAGTLGRIKGGPIVAKIYNASDYHVWWSVEYDLNPTGWTASEFLKPYGGSNWLSFAEGNPGIPGDGIFVNAASGQYPWFFELTSPISFGQFIDGFTITVFPPSNVQDIYGISFDVTNFRDPYDCGVMVGAGELLSGNTVFNNINGFFVNIPQSTISHFVDLANQAWPGCNIRAYDLFLYFIYFYPPDGQNITTLDAAIILPGQNAVP